MKLFFVNSVQAQQTITESFETAMPHISATTTYYASASYNGCVNATRTPVVATVATHYDAGTGIAINGTTITNTAPDQTVNLTGTGATTVTGSYPNFTISSTDNNTSYAAGTGLILDGNTFNSVWTISENDIYSNKSGNVGIGTSTPTTTLEVNGTLKLTIGTPHLGDILTSDANGNATWTTPAQTPKKWENGTGNYANDIFRLNGNVGIGTTAPYKPLTVNGDVSFINYGNNHNNSFEILGQGQIPTRRGISIDDDPSGMMNFWIHDWQSSAFNFVKNDGFGTPASFSSLMTILQNGNVGIGLVDPDAKLSVGLGANLWTQNSWNKSIELPTTGAIKWGSNGTKSYGIGQTDAGLYFISSSSDDETASASYNMFIGNNGNVGIGTEDIRSDCKLAVNGNIWAQEVKVYPANPYGDFVFEEDYKLMNLTELDKFLKLNKHLPGVPTAEDAKNGVEMGNMSLTLLQKTEENMLYILQLKKENDLLKVEIENLKKLVLDIKTK